jgi:hypothetical protein
MGLACQEADAGGAHQDRSTARCPAKRPIWERRRMPTDQEMTIIDVIHAALDRVSLAMAITITSGILVELFSNNGIDRDRALQLLKTRYDEYLVETG